MSAPGTSAAAAAAPAPALPASAQQPPQALSPQAVRSLCLQAFPGSSAVCLLRRCAVETLHAVQKGPTGPGSMLASDFRMKLQHAGGQAWNLCPSFEGSKVKSVLVGAEAVFKAKYVPGETSKAVVLDLEGLQEVAADPNKCTEWTPSPAANTGPPAPAPGPQPPMPGPSGKGGKPPAGMQPHVPPAHLGEGPGSRELSLVMMAMALYRPGTAAAPNEHMATLRCKLACLLARAADSPLGPHMALGTHLGDALGKYASEAWQALPSAGSRLQRLADSCLVVEQGGGGLAMRLDVQELERQAQQAALQEWRSLGPLPGSGRKGAAVTAQPDVAGMAAAAAGTPLPAVMGLDPSGHLPPAKDDDFGLAIAAATISVWCPQKWHLAAAVLAMLGQPGPMAMRNGGRTCSHVGFFLKEVQRIAAMSRVPQGELSTKFLSASEPLLAFNSSGMPQGIVSLQVAGLAQTVLSAVAAAAGSETAALRQPACWPPNVQDFPVGQLHQQAQPLARHLVHVLSGQDGVEARSQLLSRIVRQLEMLANLQQPQSAVAAAPSHGPAMQLHPLQQQQQVAAAAAAAAGMAVRAMAAQNQAGVLQQRPSVGAPGTPLQQPGGTFVQMPNGQLVALAPNQVAAAGIHPGMMPGGNKAMLMQPNALPNALLQQFNAQQAQNAQQMLLAAQHAAQHASMGMPAMQQQQQQQQEMPPVNTQRVTQLLLTVYPHGGQDPASNLRKTAAVHLMLAQDGPLGPQSMMLADICRVLRNDDMNSWQALFGNQPESNMLRDAVNLLHNAPGFAVRPGSAFEIAVQLDVASLERAAMAAAPMGLPPGLANAMRMGGVGLPQPGLQLAGAAAAAAAGTQAIQAAMQAQQAQQQAQQHAQQQAQQHATQQTMMQLGMQVMASAGSASSAGGGGNMGGMPTMTMRPSLMGGMPSGGAGPGQQGASPSMASGMQHSGSLGSQGAGMQLNSMAPVFVPGQDPHSRSSQQGNMLSGGANTPSHVLMNSAASASQTGPQGAPSVDSTTSSLAGAGGGGGGGRPPGNGSNGSGNAEGGALPASLSPTDGGDHTHKMTNCTDSAQLTTAHHGHNFLVGGLLHSLQAAIQAAGTDHFVPPKTGALRPATGAANHLSKQRATEGDEGVISSNSAAEEHASPAQLRLWASQAFSGQDAVSIVRLAAVHLLCETSQGLAGPYSMDGPALGLALAKQQPDAYRALPCSAQGKLRLKAVCDGCAVFERNHTHQTQVCIKLNIPALHAAAEAVANGAAVPARAHSKPNHARAHSHGKLSSIADGMHSGRNTPGILSPASQAIMDAAEAVYSQYEPMRDLKLAAVRILAAVGPDAPDGPRVRPLGNYSMMGPEFGNAMSRIVPAAWGSMAGSNKLAKLCSGDRFLEVGVSPSGDNRAIRLDTDALLAAVATQTEPDLIVISMAADAAVGDLAPTVPPVQTTTSGAAAAMHGMPPDIPRPKSETAAMPPRSPVLRDIATVCDAAAIGVPAGATTASVITSKTAPNTPRPGGILPHGSTMIGLNPAACQYWPTSPIKVPQFGEALAPERQSVGSSQGSSSLASMPEGSKPSGSTPHTSTSRSTPFQAADALEYARATVTAVAAFEPVKGMLHQTACRVSSGVGDEVLEGALRHQETALLHLIAE